MRFRELMKQLESRVGSHQLPLNPRARELKDLFESCALHHEFALELVRGIYRGNACRQLDDPVDRERTLQALSPLRLSVLRSERADVDLVRFVDDVCVALDAAFRSAAPEGRPAPLDPPRSAQVIPLAPFLRQARLRSFAGNK